MASNNSGLKRTESIADTMPEALKKARYHMKRCFAKYTEKGRRTLKLHQLMDETAEAIDDVTERNQVLEGLLGYILCSTQPLRYIYFICFTFFLMIFFFPLFTIFLK